MNALGLSSIAIRVHNVDAMTGFYSEAFGISFRDVDTFGMTSKFGEIGSVTLKLVPIRDETDFEGYPVHQLGLCSVDVERLVEIAVKHGGRLEGEIVRDGTKISAAIRDPDGNTLELYSEG